MEAGPVLEEFYLKGRGAQINPHNKFDPRQEVREHWEGIDELPEVARETKLFSAFPKTILNKVESPDVGAAYSLNPYQGCEHGCLYCYARNSHEYWGFSAGLDFESRIVIKHGAADLLRKVFDNPKWKPVPLMLAGNTDCYQPVERELRITRSLLEVMWEYRHPVGIITKNALILRDLDLLQQMAAENLVHANISLTTLNEDLRRRLEPRTVTGKGRLKTIQQLAQAGVPVNVMVAPIIPGLNSHEVPTLIQAAAQHGATNAGMTIVRLNGAIGIVFKDWLEKNYPDAADKVWHQIQACHGGKVNDSRFGIRMRGEGPVAEQIHQLFAMAKKKYMQGGQRMPYNLNAFKRPTAQQSLF